MNIVDEVVASIRKNRRRVVQEQNINGASQRYIDDWQSRWNEDGLAILERRSAKEVAGETA